MLSEFDYTYEAFDLVLTQIHGRNGVPLHRISTAFAYFPIAFMKGSILRMLRSDPLCLCHFSMFIAACRTSPNSVEWKLRASSGVTDFSNLLNALSIRAIGGRTAAIMQYCPRFSYAKLWHFKIS